MASNVKFGDHIYQTVQPPITLPIHVNRQLSVANSSQTLLVKHTTTTANTETKMHSTSEVTEDMAMATDDQSECKAFKVTKKLTKQHRKKIKSNGCSPLVQTSDLPTNNNTKDNKGQLKVFLRKMRHGELTKCADNATTNVKSKCKFFRTKSATVIAADKIRKQRKLTFIIDDQLTTVADPSTTKDGAGNKSVVRSPRHRQSRCKQNKERSEKMRLRSGHTLEYDSDDEFDSPKRKLAKKNVDRRCI